MLADGVTSDRSVTRTPLALGTGYASAAPAILSQLTTFTSKILRINCYHGSFLMANETWKMAAKNPKGNRNGYKAVLKL